MATKLQMVSELTARTMQKLTHSVDEWMSFLDSVAWLYKYPWHEQVMIYAQRPDATACASIELWNNAFRRWVNKGTKGIAIIDDSGAKPSLRYGLRKINAMRTLTTESTAVLMPFRAHEIMDIGGVYCGVNAISRNLIIADRKQLINGNGFILGVSGSGKSFFAKREIIFLLLGTNDDIIIGDPQNEYTSLVNALGGAVVNLSPTSSNHINALDLSLGYGDKHNPIVAKTEFVLSFFEALLEKDLPSMLSIIASS